MVTAAAYLGRAGLSALVLECREIIGGCCVTEEISPGCRTSTTSYIASMLRPEVIRDLRLAKHGLRMVPCDPALQVPFSDGTVLPWWAQPERAAAEFSKISAKDAQTFLRVDQQLKTLASYPAFFSHASAHSWHVPAGTFRLGIAIRANTLQDYFVKSANVASSLDRIHVDCEPPFAIFLEALNCAAAFRKTLALSHQERTRSLKAAYYLGEMLVLDAANEDKRT
jgi:hypothetical protein